MWDGCKTQLLEMLKMFRFLPVTVGLIDTCAAGIQDMNGQNSRSEGPITHHCLTTRKWRRASVTCSEPEVDIGPSIRLQTDKQAALLREISRHYPEFDWSETPESGQRFYFGNKFFEIGDAVILYALLRRFRPKRIIEVRSGFSSALMMDSNDRFLGGSIRFTFIEPYSERLRSLLTDQDKGRIDLLETVVQNVPGIFSRHLFKNNNYAPINS